MTRRSIAQRRRSTQRPRLGGSFLLALIGILLIVISLWLYWPAREFGFAYDDVTQIVGEPSLRLGLTREGIAWAVTSVHSANWYPLTLLSHLLDVQAFGVHAGSHHLVNILLHASNTLLLFAAFRALTGATVCAAVVAALLAVHPLHVESVAWVSERKGLLCAFFWLLSTLAYVWYNRRRTSSRYLPVFVFSALAMLSKPAAVTLPFALLLLDYWPLGRLSFDPPAPAGGSPRSHIRSAALVLLEKGPLLALAAASSVITYAAQRGAGAIGSTTSYPLSLRVGNALVSYADYLLKTLWPRDLTALYLFPLNGLPASAIVSAGFVLGCATIAGIGLARRHPYLAAGWLWFLGTLVPVMGFVQVGMQSMADRYTYIPHIGLFSAVVWGFGALVKNRPANARMILGVGGMLVLCLLTSTSRKQLWVWQSNRTLYEKMVNVDPGNWVAQTELGLLAMEEGNAAEGIALYRASLRANPDYPLTHYNLAVALQTGGRLDEAERHYRAAIRLGGARAESWHNLGTIAWGRGRKAEATAHFSRAVSADPGFADAYHSLGVAFLERSDPEQAATYFEKSVQLDPRNAVFVRDLARARMEAGRRRRPGPDPSSSRKPTHRNFLPRLPASETTSSLPAVLMR